MQAGNERLTREEHKKKQELELARKAGTAPAEVDEDGNEINPHIPQYISAAPWYLNTSAPTLKHQRNLLETVDYDKGWYGRKTKLKAATKFRKGACTNCGAMTHKRKDCVERPRKKGAKFTGADIKADEIVQELTLDFDGKRDRWNGYDASEYKRVIERFDRTEKARQEVKAKELQEKMAKKKKKKEKKAKVTVAKGEGNAFSSDSTSDSDELDSDDDDDMKEKDKRAMMGYIDTKQRVSVRNLRIREDTAKYLLNLDVNSAYYDPKSRAMRENPNPESNDPNHIYKGDNAVRYTGDASEFLQQQLFAWEAHNQGTDVHTLAAPSQAALLNKQFKEKKDKLMKERKEKVLEQYGGAEHLEKPDDELLLAQTENYIEYSRDGRVLKGQERAAIKSKYEEDVLTGNHTKVWGSYWEGGRWGFGCCNSLNRNAFCTGEKGKAAASKRLALEARNLSAEEAAAESKNQTAAAAAKAQEETPPEEEEEDSSSSDKKSKKKKKKKKRKRSDSSSSEDFDRKVKKAMKEQEKAEKEAEEQLQLGDRDRPYNSAAKGMVNTECTDAEMEAYHLRKTREDDPMAKYVDKS